MLRRLGARYKEQGSVRAELFNFRDFPGARKFEEGSARVVGEVYRLPNPERSLRILDEVEGVRPASSTASLFRREIVEVTLESGKRVKAWVYWITRNPGPRRRIPSGDYAKM